MAGSNLGSLSKAAYPLGISLKWIGYILAASYIGHSVIIAGAIHKPVSDVFCRHFLPVNLGVTFERAGTVTQDELETGQDGFVASPYDKRFLITSGGDGF